MHNVLFMTLSSIDNDSRILKELCSLQKLGCNVSVMSSNTKRTFDFKQYIIKHVPGRKFGIPGSGRIFRFYALLKTFFSIDRNQEVIHCHDLNTLPLGVLMKVLFSRGAKIVYDAHEYETEVNGLGGLRKRMAKFLERSLIGYADKVITVSDSIAAEYVRLYGIEKPALVLNCPSMQEPERRDLFRERFGLRSDQTVFLYQGGFSRDRGIEILLEAFKELTDRNVIVFMGYGKLEPLIREYSRKYRNIHLHEAVPADILLQYTSAADIGILFYENSCLNHYYCSPNKMFEYIMGGLPVIVSNLYEMKKIVEENKIGVVAEENSVYGLQQAIEQIGGLDREELRRNVQMLRRKYRWEEQEQVLLGVYRELLA